MITLSELHRKYIVWNEVKFISPHTNKLLLLLCFVKKNNFRFKNCYFFTVTNFTNDILNVISPLTYNDFEIMIELTYDLNFMRFLYFFYDAFITPKKIRLMLREMRRHTCKFKLLGFYKKRFPKIYAE
jgi:hypothetical protein